MIIILELLSMYIRELCANLYVVLAEYVQNTKNLVLS